LDRSFFVVVPISVSCRRRTWLVDMGFGMTEQGRYLLK